MVLLRNALKSKPQRNLREMLSLRLFCCVTQHYLRT